MGEGFDHYGHLHTYPW